MKSSFSKFLLFSVMVVSSLGALKCERQQAASLTVGSGQAKAMVAMPAVQQQAQERPAPMDDDQREIPVRFPNIFDVFRSLF